MIMDLVRGVRLSPYGGRIGGSVWRKGITVGRVGGGGFEKRMAWCGKGGKKLT